MHSPGAFDLPDPIDVGRAQFETVKRGYEPSEVRSYLTEVAQGLGHYRELVKELERRVASLETELEESNAAASVELTEKELTERLGAETAKVLLAAREAAAERQATQEAELAQQREQADQEVATARAEAIEVLETTRAEADQAAADLLADADADIAEMKAAARDEIERSLASAEAEHQDLVEDGRRVRDDHQAEGRAMVAEAQVVRERILGDLAKRRQSGRRELEQIRAGRDRLLAAFTLANEEGAGILEELTVSLPEARAAAQRAGHSIDLDEVTTEQIERELEAARLVGHPLVDMTGRDSADDAPAAPVAAADDETDDQPTIETATSTDDDGDGSSDAEPSIETESATIKTLEDDGDNVVLAELGARRSRLTKAGRIANQLPTGEIPVLKAPPPFEVVRVIDDNTPAEDTPNADTPNADTPNYMAVGDDGSDGPELTDDHGTEELPVDGGRDAPDGEVDEASADGSETENQPVGEPDAELDATAGEFDADLDAATGDVDADEAESVAQVDVEADDTDEPDAEAESVAEFDVDAEPAADEANAAESESDAEEADRTPVEAAAPDAEVTAAAEPDVQADDAVDGSDEAEETFSDDHRLEPIPDVDSEAVELLFAKVRAGRTSDDSAAAVATLTRTDEQVTVLDDDPLAARDRATRTLETAVTRSMKRALADDQNELLDAARQAKKLTGLDDLVNADDHLGRYLEPVRADLVEAFHAGATAGGDPSIDTDLASAERAIETEFVSRLRDDLGSLVEGEPDNFADGLRRLARDVRRNRLKEAAAHAVLTAYNQGVYGALGDGSRRWVRDERHDCGLDCEANARAGVVAADRVFDGGVGHPPMFPGCRCLLVRAPQ
ncbi:MAG: DivIVA domain-containing protein [Acidimicrobiales bacterium]